MYSTRIRTFSLVITTALLLSSCGAGESTSPTPSAPPEVLQNEVPSESPAAEAAPATTGNRASDVTPNTATGACVTADLTVSVANQEGAAGSQYLDLVFTNDARSGCQMIGFPGVSIVGLGNGTQLGATAMRDNSATDYVTLAPGKSATATVQISQAGAYDAAACQPTPGDGLRVFPPGNTNSAYVAVPGVTGCANPDLSILTVSPVR